MRNRGYTLIELVLVVAIIGILASIAAQSLISSTDRERFDTTVEEMDGIARAIVGDERLVSGGIRTDFGYVGDIGALPPDLDALMSNPGGYATWSGPYFRNDFVENTNGYKKDAWNNSYSYSGGVTIQSSGNGSSITRQFANTTADLTSNTVTGFVRDLLNAPPGDSASNVRVTIFYPDGAGSMANSTVTPSRAGEFSFTNLVPVGIHRIQAVVAGINDTTSKYAVVYPGLKSLAELRFPSALWGNGTPGGPQAGNIILVDGTQNFPGGNCGDIAFDIMNSSGSPVGITSIILTWTSPTAYYRRVRYNSTSVWQNSNPRNGSGDVAAFTSGRTIQPAEIATINVEGFEDQPIGGNPVNMQNTTFTVTFSDGSTFTMTMGVCN